MTARGDFQGDLHWAAGIFEGEGCVTIAVRNSDETYRLLCTIGNTDRQVIDPFHRWWGGWLQPAYGLRPGRKPAWSWTVAGPRAESFLRDLAPYVRTDRVRRKLDLGLRFRGLQSLSLSNADRPKRKAFQRAAYQEMRQLNRRGVA